MMSFSHAVFHPSEVAEQRLILYSPLPDHDTPAKLAGLLEELWVARAPQPSRPGSKRYAAAATAA